MSAQVLVVDHDVDPRLYRQFPVFYGIAHETGFLPYFLSVFNLRRQNFPHDSPIGAIHAANNVSQHPPHLNANLDLSRSIDEHVDETKQTVVVFKLENGNLSQSVYFALQPMAHSFPICLVREMDGRYFACELVDESIGWVYDPSIGVPQVHWNSSSSILCDHPYVRSLGNDIYRTLFIELADENTTLEQRQAMVQKLLDQGIPTRDENWYVNHMRRDIFPSAFPEWLKQPAQLDANEGDKRHNPPRTFTLLPLNKGAHNHIFTTCLLRLKTQLDEDDDGTWEARLARVRKQLGIMFEVDEVELVELNRLKERIDNPDASVLTHNLSVKDQMLALALLDATVPHLALKYGHALTKKELTNTVRQQFLKRMYEQSWPYLKQIAEKSSDDLFTLIDNLLRDPLLPYQTREHFENYIKGGKFFNEEHVRPFHLHLLAVIKRCGIAFMECKFDSYSQVFSPEELYPGASTQYSYATCKFWAPRENTSQRNLVLCRLRDNDEYAPMYLDDFTFAIFNNEFNSFVTNTAEVAQTDEYSALGDLVPFPAVTNEVFRFFSKDEDDLPTQREYDKEVRHDGKVLFFAGITYTAPKNELSFENMGTKEPWWENMKRNPRLTRNALAYFAILQQTGSTPPGVQLPASMEQALLNPGLVENLLTGKYSQKPFFTYVPRPFMNAPLEKDIWDGIFPARGVVVAYTGNPSKGLGVFATRAIPKGAFIAMVAGRFLKGDVATRAALAALHGYWIYDKKSNKIVDFSEYGNCTRFINHALVEEANCKLRTLNFTNGSALHGLSRDRGVEQNMELVLMKANQAKTVLFFIVAQRDIPLGQEITVFYSEAGKQIQNYIAPITFPSLPIRQDIGFSSTLPAAAVPSIDAFLASLDG